MFSDVVGIACGVEMGEGIKKLLPEIFLAGV
jgi:hypothetical protein